MSDTSFEFINLRHVEIAAISADQATSDYLIKQYEANPEYTKELLLTVQKIKSGEVEGKPQTIEELFQEIENEESEE